MECSRIFVVVPASDLDNLQRFCQDLVIPLWRKKIITIPVENPEDVDRDFRHEKSLAIAHNFETYEANSESVLLLQTVALQS